MKVIFMILKYSYEDPETRQLMYIEQVKNLSRSESTTVYVDFSHLEAVNEVLAEAIQSQYYR